jgi:hypothetical protein
LKEVLHVIYLACGSVSALKEEYADIRDDKPVEAGGSMKTFLAAAFSFLLVALASVVLSAKGITTRVTVTGGDLANPIVLADPVLLHNFNVWAGPGVQANGVDENQGFIIDWSSGAVAEQPTVGSRYEVSFFVKHPNRRDEHLAYVVLYASHPSGGYVYLPGPADEWYRMNTGSIFRGREGRWFRATALWHGAVEPLLVRAARR